MSAILNFKKITIFFILIFFIILPIFSLIYSGPFSWHIKQKSFIHGLLEVFIIFFSIYIFFLTKKTEYKYLLLIPILFFCRRHSIDISIIVNLIYILGLCCLGQIFLKKISPMEKFSNFENLIISLFLGIILWLLIIWLFSFFGFGNLNNIRFLAIIFLILPIIIVNPLTFIKKVKFHVNFDNKVSIFFISFLITYFLVLFAKLSFSSINFDSMWYGLRIDKILLGEGNVFAPHYFTAPVHYYPKLYESLLIPLSGFSSISIPSGFAIFILYFLLITVFFLLKNLIINENLLLPAITLIATLPAVGFISSSTKGDILAAFFLILSIFFMSQFLKKKQFYFMLSLSALILAPLARLSVLPYSFFLFCYLIFILINNYNKNIFKINYLIVFFAATFVFALINYRTFLLSGIFFVAPIQLVNIQNYLGLNTFDFIPILSRPHSPNLISDFFWGLWSYLFYPANIGIQMITWIGNSWLFCFIFYFLIKKKKYKIDSIKLNLLYLFIFCLFLFILILFTAKHNLQRGLDGNYFIFPITCGYIGAFILLNDLNLRSRYLISNISVLFSISAFLIIFCTVYWKPGIRPFDLNFKYFPNELNTKLQTFFRDKEKHKLYDYFFSIKNTPRVAGATEERKKIFFYLLPIKYESLQMILWSKNNQINLEEYFNIANINYLVLTKKILDSCDSGLSSNRNTKLCNSINKIIDKKKIPTYKNKKYIVFKLN